MTSYQGQLLIASASLNDPNFFHTVVLLVRHNDEGALGLVLNRPSGTQLSEIWEQISQATCDCEALIGVGGPIQGPLMALHDSQMQQEIEILPGIYFTADREKLEALVAVQPEHVRFFVGYAGWGGGQLEAELAGGAWLTLPAALDHAFGDSDGLWEAVSKEINGAGLFSAMGIRHVPRDPSVN